MSGKKQHKGIAKVSRRSSAVDMDWFVRARFGLFVHYGLYSLLGRGEWAMNRERIPRREYRRLASRFTAERFDADELCELALRAGARYVVLTTMHHDGFRLYETKLSSFNAVKSAARRDLVAEFVEAARKRGLRVGLYHSLNNWMDEPDGVAALESKRAYKAFIEATFERIRELVTKFNPIDTLWYDGWWPFDAKGWQAERMNAMVRSIQPHILVNGRNGLPGDFATPENHITAPEHWRPWEACMTHNANWGYHEGDEEWKSPGQVVDLLARCAAGKGNLLLNIGPKGDGSIPVPSRKILTRIGAWLENYGEAIFDTDFFTFGLRERGNHRGDWTLHGPLTAKGNNFYLLLRRPPSVEIAVGGLQCRVKRVTLLGKKKRELSFRQTKDRIVVEKLSAKELDDVCSVLRFECDGRPEIYGTAGMRVPTVPHPSYDPCPSDILN